MRRSATAAVKVVVIGAIGLVGTMGAGLGTATVGSAAARVQPPAPLALPVPDGVLYGVSCSSQDFCLGVGAQPGAYEISKEWNGSTWSNLPNGKSLGTYTAVDCADPTQCLAVGDRNRSPQGLGASWNGSAWKTVSPATPTSALFNGVSCSSATSCQSVGEYATKVGAPASVLGESWDGTKWSTVAAARPAGTGGADLYAVSCHAGAACMTVGQNGYAAMAEELTGGSWHVSAAKTPAKGTILRGVSCPTTSMCLAVGVDSARTAPTEQWNGTSWSLIGKPAANTGLYSVSCVSANLCFAVGWHLKCLTSGCTYVPRAQSWNGVTWTTIATPVPAKAQDSYLYGISCTSPTWCMAVGEYDVAEVPSYATLAEIWNGSSWSIAPTS